MKSYKLILWCILLCMAIETEAKKVTAKSNSLYATIDTKTFRFSINRPDGSILLSEAFAAINAPQGNTPVNTEYFKLTKATVKPFTDKIGKGKQLILTAKHKLQLYNIELRISVYDQQQAASIECIYHNNTDKPAQLLSLVPVKVINAKEGYLYFNNAKKALLNGTMYYDAGQIQELDSTYQHSPAYGETKGGKIVDHTLAGNPRTAQSWWNIGIFSDYEKEALSIGYLNNANSLGRLSLLKENEERLSLICESVYNKGLQLKPNQSISSDIVYLCIGNDPYQALEEYADAMAACNKPELGSPVNGWCNWFYSLDHYSEDEILKNATVAAQELKPYGLEFIQFDEGYQTTHGNWKGNGFFPHGLGWLANQINGLGLKAGIWISPFVISENCDVYKNHPDWLLKDENEKPMRIGPWDTEDSDWFRNETPKRYALDITHPEAEAWLTNLIDTIANHWGYEMIKIDFVAWTVFSAHHFYDRSATPSQVYRKAIDIIRKTAGDKCHILDCGPGHVSAGLFNSMRIEYDQNYGYYENVMKQYLWGESCSAGALGKRFFYHKKAWINDIDHICIDLLPNRQAETVASLIALSGGNTMSGDRLYTLDASKMEILKKAFPASGEYARPVDLLESDPQTVFVTHIERPFAQWSVAGFFNPDINKSVQKTFSLDRLSLCPDSTYLCFDFWNKRFAGEITSAITTEVAPGGVTLLSLHSKQGIPQVVSTDRHILQGAVELSNVVYDRDNNTLSGTSCGPQNSAHSVYIYVPKGYDWYPQYGKLYDDMGQYSIKKTEPRIVRIDLKFKDEQTIAWKINFRRVDY